MELAKEPNKILDDLTFVETDEPLIYKPKFCWRCNQTEVKNGNQICKECRAVESIGDGGYPG